MIYLSFHYVNKRLIHGFIILGLRKHRSTFRIAVFQLKKLEFPYHIPPKPSINYERSCLFSCAVIQWSPNNEKKMNCTLELIYTGSVFDYANQIISYHLRVPTRRNIHRGKTKKKLTVRILAYPRLEKPRPHFFPTSV